MDLKELMRKYAEKRKEFDSLKNEENLEEARKVFEEARELKERIELLQEERTLDLPSFHEEKVERKIEGDVEVRDLSEEDLDKEYEGVFLKAFRGKKLNRRDMDVYDRMVEMREAPNASPYLKSAVDEDGGFIVPKSVSTLIQTYKRELEFDLTTLVDVQKTAVVSGEFTYEKLSTITPFAKLSQWDTIPEVGTPQFERKSFKIEDYAGILPIPRTLLQDTDENLLNYIAKFIARKSVVTRNSEILKVLSDTYTEKQAVATTDDIKTILNVTLDRAFLANTRITTNQDGFNVLDKLKDSDGRYLLQPDVTDPTQKRLFGYLVQVLPNATLKSVESKAPFIVGDLYEAVRFYDRGVYEITPTTVGGDSFKRNSLDIRVIDRFDVISLDKDAVVYGELTVA